MKILSYQNNLQSTMRFLQGAGRVQDSPARRMSLIIHVISF